ncbi:MAG: radical SAM-associated putative lipoprotein [Bacteroidales bacterium]|nr:radical SAM-associated putative lipoprotein [Bacteroidales bacterium]
MKQMLNKWWTRILVMFLALLGYACGDSEKEEDEIINDDVVQGQDPDDDDDDIYGPELYGCPSASYKVTGSVTDNDNEPVEGAKVKLELDYYQKASTLTAKDGTFTVDIYGVQPYSDYACLITSCDGYLSDTLRVKFSDLTGGDGHWYWGEGTAIATVKLNPKPTTENN